MSRFDERFAVLKIVATALGAGAKVVLANLVGAQVGDTEDDAETATGVALRGVLGLITRPRPKDASGAAEATCARTDDGFTVLSTIDRRLSRARGNVNEGSVNLVGYGKAFISIDDASSGGGSVVTIYAPYAFDGQGVAQKAHVVTVDTTTGNEGISLVHALGHAVLLTKDGNVVLKNKAGDATITIGDDGIVVGGQLKAATSLVAGDIAGAKPVMLADIATNSWVNQVNAALTALAGAVGAVVPPLSAPTASPSSSTALRAT